jgi:hypothetical protein
MADLEDAVLDGALAPRGGADDNIQVLVRVRPPNARELEQVRACAGTVFPLACRDAATLSSHDRPPCATSPPHARLCYPPLTSFPSRTPPPTQGYHKGVLASGRTIEALGKAHSSYSYDHVCDEHQSQGAIFESVGVPVTDAFLEGYHGCLIAYGQTGAGKTFTMQGPGDPDESSSGELASGEGTDGAGAVNDPEAQGLIPRVLQRIFQRVTDETNGTLIDADTPEDKKPCDVQFVVKCSYLEIYNETVADLLAPAGTTNAERNAPVIREHDKKGIFVEGLTEAVVTNAEETYDLFTKGSFNRRVGMTEMNRESSRSHAVFTVSLESKRRPCQGAALQKRSALLHLVDLAGSERQKSTEAGGARLKEASAINKSLSALGNVIKALVDVADGKDRHVPYRDSKLTYLLKDALGGKARCTLLACVSPATGQLEETLSTLKFAQRAKLVKVKATLNEVVEGSAQELAVEVSRLRALIAAGGGGGVDAGAVARLEQHVARANRVAAAAAFAASAQTEQLTSKLAEVDELSKRLEKNLQSTKMVLRLRDEALKKKTTAAGDDAGKDTEMEALRKLAECPPEVVRIRVEMQALRSRMEHLERENDVHPHKGRLAALELELGEIRVVRLEEGTLAASAIERAFEAEAAREIAETAIAGSEARAETAEGLVAQAEEAAAFAAVARSEAERGQAQAEAAMTLAEENAARVQATFEEQKAVMEEMFLQIESLDTLRVDLEKKLVVAAADTAAAAATLAELDETKAELDATKNALDATKTVLHETKATAAAATEQAAAIAVKLTEADAALASAISSAEATRATLVNDHAAALAAAETRRVDDVAAAENALHAAEQSFKAETSALVAAHNAALDAQKATLESNASDAAQTVADKHADALDAARTAAAETLVSANEAAANALDAAKASAAEDLDAAKASADEALEIAKTAAEELEAAKTLSARATETALVSAAIALAEAKAAFARELEAAKAAADEALAVAKAAAAELELTKAQAAEALDATKASAAQALDAVQATAAAALAAAKASAASTASEGHEKMLEAIHAEHAQALHEARVVAKTHEQALQQAAEDALAAARALQAAKEATATAVDAASAARADATASAATAAERATALERATADGLGLADAAEQAEEALAAAKAAAEETSKAFAEELETTKKALAEALASVSAANASCASNDARIEAARSEAASKLVAEEIAHATTRQALEASLCEISKIEKDLKGLETAAAAASASVATVSSVSATKHAHDLARQKETLESAAKAGMRAQEKMLASAEGKLAEANAALESTRANAATAVTELARVRDESSASSQKSKHAAAASANALQLAHRDEMEALRVSLENEARAGHAAAAGAREHAGALEKELVALRATNEKAGVMPENKDGARGVDGAMTAALISARVDAEELAERALEEKAEALHALEHAREELATANTAAETSAARTRRAVFQLEALKANVAREKAAARAAKSAAAAVEESKTIVETGGDEKTPARKTPAGRASAARKESGKGASQKAPKSTPKGSSKVCLAFPKSQDCLTIRY